MKIAVVTNNSLKEELIAQGLQEGWEPEWLETPRAVTGVVAYIDLLFTPVPARINALIELKPALVLVNELNCTTAELPEGFIRFNGWKSFLKRPVMEAAGGNEETRTQAGRIFSCFGKKTEWVPDTPGFISARIVSMIINEAYFTLEEKVSSKEEIDIAMKLGTNYPYGPFEWSGLIGLQNIYELLKKLAAGNARYTAADLLMKEATKQ